MGGSVDLDVLTEDGEKDPSGTRHTDQPSLGGSPIRPALEDGEKDPLPAKAGLSRASRQGFSHDDCFVAFHSLHVSSWETQSTVMFLYG